MRAIIAGLALCLACACAPGPAAGPQPAAPSTRAEITASCGGGFTGGTTGVTITAEDHVVRWDTATAGAQRRETDLGARPALAAEIRRQLEAIQFADVRYDRTGNMTCTLRAGDHSVSWPQGDASAPAGVVTVHAAVLEADGVE
jgi:hypothetical protein